MVFCLGCSPFSGWLTSLALVWAVPVRPDLALLEVPLLLRGPARPSDSARTISPASAGAWPPLVPVFLFFLLGTESKGVEADLCFVNVFNWEKTREGRNLCGQDVKIHSCYFVNAYMQDRRAQGVST